MKIRADGTAVLESAFDWSPIRFNAQKKEFSKGIDNLKLNFGAESIGSMTVLGRHSTQADFVAREYIAEVQKIVALDATATVAENIWGSLPTYSSYVNLEELYDVDETQDLYMQASKQRGW